MTWADFTYCEPSCTLCDLYPWFCGLIVFIMLCFGTLIIWKLLKFSSNVSDRHSANHTKRGTEEEDEY